MFHFTLVHIPGTHHGPDGLSRRRPQADDDEEPEDDFEDWVDQVNGFLHFIDPLPLKFIPFQPLPRFLITDTVDEDTQDSTEDIFTPTSADLPTPYSIVPRSDTAKLADEKLSKVQHWLETLECPSSMTDSQYKTFMRYCTEFFIMEG